ncbi:hypothetical protein [Leuconostoc gasicomitatum]|nr:hypothetical protein [Leuconostoc gasicomitatum]MBZ5969013.1 hypothetical protein [Leuconostoc gasicomitatum]MBZ5998503.1 hypothetical protein [Leuconostoc gasicomitatum]
MEKTANWYGYKPEDVVDEMKQGDLLFVNGKVFKKEKSTLEEIKNA